MSLSPLFLAGGISLFLRQVGGPIVVADCREYALVSGSSDSYAEVSTPAVPSHPDTPTLQSYRRHYFQREKPNPWLIRLYSYDVEKEWDSLKNPFSWEAFSAHLSRELDSRWRSLLPQAERNRRFDEVQNQEYEKFLAGPTPKKDQELTALVAKLRHQAAALGVDFDPTETILNAWDRILAPGQSSAQIIDAFRKAEQLFSSPQDNIIVEALTLARGFLLLQEKKYSEARAIARTSGKSRFTSIRYFGRMLRTDAELRLGGYPAPAYSVPAFDLSQQKGKVVVLYFWQTWCSPCAKKLPELQALHQKYNGRVAFIGISSTRVEPNAADLTSMREKLGVTFPQITDGGFSTDIFRIFYYPRAIIVDKKGRAWLLMPEQNIEKELQRFL